MVVLVERSSGINASSTSCETQNTRLDLEDVHQYEAVHPVVDQQSETSEVPNACQIITSSISIKRGESSSIAGIANKENGTTMDSEVSNSTRLEISLVRSNLYI